MPHHTLQTLVFSVLISTALAGCQGAGTVFPSFPENPNTVAGASPMAAPPAPVIRQPVLPEYLVGCRAHVLVPALGMTFVSRGGYAPTSGQYLREERLTAPYRIIRPGDRLSQDRINQRMNVELDSYGRVVGLACG